jgi:hypothetical protein
MGPRGILNTLPLLGPDSLSHPTHSLVTVPTVPAFIVLQTINECGAQCNRFFKCQTKIIGKITFVIGKQENWKKKSLETFLKQGR